MSRMPANQPSVLFQALFLQPLFILATSLRQTRSWKSHSWVLSTWVLSSWVLSSWVLSSWVLSSWVLSSKAILSLVILTHANLLPGQELLPPLNEIPFQVATEANESAAPFSQAGLGDPSAEPDQGNPATIAPSNVNTQEFRPEEFAPNGEQDLELLTRGPLHEAFAVSPSDEPLPGVIVQRKPPTDVKEVPPEYESADGDESESIWIPGYWAWDEDREDYIWVSGAWRVSPPDRNWIPGYWHRANNGHQWISGFWAPSEVEQLSYVEPPPATLENGPSIPSPSNEHFWIPGNWVYQTSAYNWNPGRWCAHREDRVWIPAHYVHTPSGCIYVNGYWDYQLPLRGQLYAPVYFQRPVVTYRPRCEIRAGNLFMHLFVSRRHRHYFFGDYYDARYRARGCYPLHNYRHAARRYDPLYSYYRTHFALQGIDCRARLSGWHNYYSRHVHHRPPRTWSAYASFGIHMASHPHLSRTVLARAPRYASININLGPSRSLTHGHHNPPPRHRAGSRKLNHRHRPDSHHEHLRDLAHQRRRLEQKNASIAATHVRGQRGVPTRIEKLTIPNEIRTKMPRNTFARPPKLRHDDAIVDVSMLGRRQRDKHGPTRHDHRDVLKAQRTVANPSNRPVPKKDRTVHSKSGDKRTRLDVESDLQRRASRSDKKQLALTKPAKVRSTTNKQTVVRGNNENEINKSISRRLEELRQRARHSAESRVQKEPNKPASNVDVRPHTGTPEHTATHKTNSRKSRKPKPKATPTVATTTPQPIASTNTNDPAVKKSRPSRVKLPKPARVKTPKPPKPKKTKNNVVRAPSPAPRTVSKPPRQVSQPRQIQAGSVTKRTIAESTPPRALKSIKAPKSVNRSSRVPKSAAPSPSSVSKRQSIPKRTPPPKRTQSPSRKKQTRPTVSRSSRSASPPPQSNSYQRKQPKSRKVQPKPVQPRSAQPRPQPRSIQPPRSVKSSRPTPSPSASRSRSQRSTNRAPKTQRAPKPQRAPKQQKSKGGKKKR